MVTPARAGMAGPAVVTGATGRNTNHTTDSFLTADKKTKRNKEDDNIDTWTEISHYLRKRTVLYDVLCNGTNFSTFKHTKHLLPC